MSSSEVSALAIIAQFEQAWQVNPPADLDAYLLAPGHPCRQEVLFDLVHIDLEYRWKAGARPLVEEYLNRFPELVQPRLVIDLVCWECQLRQRLDGTVSVEDLLRRFPDQAKELTARLQEFALSAPGAEEGRTRWPTMPGYKLLGERSRDALGVVYEAEQIVPTRAVLVRVIRVDLSLHPLLRQQFLAEVRKWLRLDHPGIVRVHEGEICQGQPYIVYEDPGAVSLDDLLVRNCLSGFRSAALVAHLADVIEYSHQQGVIHGDLGLGDVRIVRGPTCARITNFGITHLFHADWARPVDVAAARATDIRHLGQILQRCLLSSPVPPPELTRICRRALGLEAPAHATAGDLAVDLRCYLRRRWTRCALLLAGVVLMVSALVAWLWP